MLVFPLKVDALSDADMDQLPEGEILPEELLEESPEELPRGALDDLPEDPVQCTSKVSQETKTT